MIATVIVFAESSEQAGARASRQIGRNGYRIGEVKRMMAVEAHQVDRLEGALKALYNEAEQKGIAALFDGWKKVNPAGTRS